MNLNPHSFRSRLGFIACLTTFFSLSLPTPTSLQAVQKPTICQSLWQTAYDHPRLAATACTLLAGSVAWYSYSSREKKPLTWNWKQLEDQGALTVEKLAFPHERFLWGVGTSAQQVEGGCTNNSWSDWEKKRMGEKTPNPDGTDFECAGSACNQWCEKQLDADIKSLQDLGVNAYRFSIEWSKVEPREGEKNEDAINHYEMVCKKLVDAGIRPVITLHHYTDPIWFMYGKGGFEHQKNNKHYVAFCTIVFERLNKYKPLWLTFNSPASYALNSYYQGQRPPGKTSAQTAMHVLGNMLHAHADAYHAMKALAKSKKEESEIGILHNIYQLDLGSRFNPLDHLARSFGNSMTNTCVYDFFNTGVFKVWVPGKANVNLAQHPKAIGALDFIGLNYYSHAYLSKLKPMRATDEIPTDNPRYSIYAEGLYRAIEELTHEVTQPLKKLNGKDIGIYVTENGIATNQDATRDLFFKRTLYALSQSCKTFKNVKGYIHWSFIDNYEWGTYTKKYGVYSVDFGTQERRLKPGANHFKKVIAHHKS